jgi:hypothetical protein
MQRALLVLVLLTCIVPVVHAVRVPGLYEAEVAVPDQSNGARVQGVLNALRAVIIKLTGDRGAPEKAEVALILRAAERYLQQYRYQEFESATGKPGAPVPGELRLWAQFSQTALDRDLRGAGLSIWGAERPATLAWLALGDDRGWRWAGGEGNDDRLQALADVRARARGLGLIFPLHDLDDDARLGAEAVAATDITAIGQASTRYHPDSVLAVALDSPAPGSWRAHWTLLLGSETEQWGSEGQQLDELLHGGIDVLADHLARRFAAAGAGADQSGVTLNIVAVNSATGYARALHYLQSLNSVTLVQVTEVAGDNVTFELSAYGGADAVHQAITLGRVLEPTLGPGHTYRLVP